MTVFENIFWTLCVVFVMADLAQAADNMCNDGGRIAGAVLGTFFVTIVLVIAGYFFYEYYWKKRKDKHPVLVGDPENVKDEFAFDNPGFKTETGVLPKPGGWPKLNSSIEKPANNVEGRTFLDDTFPEGNRGSTIVPLWSKDFTGLGFEVSGSMRDGIYVSRVLRGGPAHESGKIHTGDRINSVRISFRNMVYEDALNILSFASPYELQLEVQSPQNNSTHDKDIQTRLTAILAGNVNDQRSPASTMQATGDKSKKNPGYDSLDKNWKAGGKEIKHPVIGIKRSRCNSNGDLSTIEKSTKQHYFMKPPASPNSTLDASNHSKNTPLKKMFTDKINSSTLEKNKQFVKDNRNSNSVTLERENEKNAKNRVNNEHEVISKPERTKLKGMHEINNGTRAMTPPDVVIIKDGGDMYSVKNEKAEVQKKEPEAKKGMKFGIRVLPPNIPDDTMMNIKSPRFENMKYSENGNVVSEVRSMDEVDKSINKSNPETHVKEGDGNKTKSAPVVAKRREKPLAPIPNVRNVSQNNLTASVTLDMDQEKAKLDNSSEFQRENELNSSGIKRDSRGIPQEIPQHMLEAALCARNNRKSAADVADRLHFESTTMKFENNENKDTNKNAKKSKGKAPSPPDGMNSKDDSALESTYNDSNGMNFTDNFIAATNNSVVEKMGENFVIDQDTNRSDDMILNNGMMNTSTPKVEKPVKRMRPDIPVQKFNDSIIDGLDDISYEVKSFKKKEISDSMNNFFDDSKSDNSNFDSTQDSISSNLQMDTEKIVPSSTMIELNSSDITIHSSPVSELEEKMPDDNERKASSLGDLSKFDISDKLSCSRKVSQGTLERAQSLDISSEETKVTSKDKSNSAKKRKSNSVFDGDYYNDTDSGIVTNANDVSNQILTHSKEPRLSLDISNISSMDGLNTFQKNRLKKASEWGNLEDAIIIKKDGSSSGSSEMVSSLENISENVKDSDKNVEIETIDTPVTINKVDEVNFVIKTKEMPSVPILEKEATIEKNLSEIVSIETNYVQKKPEVPIRNKIIAETNHNIIPNFEIGTYVTENANMKFKPENAMISSGKISPKLEEKLTLIYDTNIPDDIKVSRHTLVSSLERPKSDLMKKLLAQNPTLTSNIDSQIPHMEVEDKSDKNPDICLDKNALDHKVNSTFTLLNQPDIVNLRIKPNVNEQESVPQTFESDYISSINIIGATTKTEASDPMIEKSTTRNFFSTNDNIVTITTDGSQPSSIIMIEGDQNIVENFRNSIEINADKQDDVINSNETSQSDQSLYNEIISELQKSKNVINENSQTHVLTSSKTYFTEPDKSELSQMMETERIVMPTQETVTVNVVDDGHGNKIITQNIEKTTQFVTVTTPIQSEGSELNLIENISNEEVDIVTEVETTTVKMVSNIPMYNVEVNTNDSKESVVENLPILAPKLHFDNEMKDTGVKIIKMQEAVDSHNMEEKSDLSYTLEFNNEMPKDYVTEIEVSTPAKQNTVPTQNKIVFKEQHLAKEVVDPLFMDDFLSNERRFSAKEKIESEGFDRRRSNSPDKIQNGKESQKDDADNRRHSDFDLPRNTHIKFRTTTYEQSNPVPTRLSTEKRLSQIEILKSNFEKGSAENLSAASSYKPTVFSKPSNIPIKLPEKPLSPQKLPTISPSKIPVLNSQNQKSTSQENLSFDKNASLLKTPSKSLSLGNISVTSIKSSSRNPSGK